MHSKYTLLVRKSTLAAALGAAVIALAACQPVSPSGAMPTAAATAQATPEATPETTAEATAHATATADASSDPNADASADASAGTVQVNVTADGIDMPAEVPSGIVTFAYQMGEDAPGMPEFARLNDGVTLDQFMTAAEQDVMAAVPLVTMIGNSAEKVGTEVTYDLKPGDYVGLIFTQSGPPLTASFTAGAATGAAEPQAGVTAQLADFAFILPDEIAAGPQTWQIENAGGQWHEMGIVKLAEGTNVDDLLAMVDQQDQSGPPPFEALAFLSPIGAGQRAWITWDLPAGEYTVICFLPDLAGDMSPHAAHGMVRTLVVK
ncbi:MAG: hypothetical protein U0X20_11285 [Caldilineaceae bacterium]